MIVDNFESIREHLEFKDPFDRYIIHILCRTKDAPDQILGSNEYQRMLRTYYVENIDYFDKKKDAIKELCRKNYARAYFLPQVRNNNECLINMMKVICDNLQNPNVKPNNLVKSAYCGFHKSREPRWIIDVDEENLHIVSSLNLIELVKQEVKNTGRNPDAVWWNPSVTGMHIITPKFNPMILPEDVRSWIHKDGMTLLYFEKE